MQYRAVGSSGLTLSAVGLGCNNFGWRIDFEAARRVVTRALDAGITHFDTANIYGENSASETFLGRLLGARRKDIVLATKFGLALDDTGKEKGGSRAAIMAAVDGSLRRLQTDYIDIYYQHVPDPAVPIEETLRALDDLVRQGKVRCIGNSNFSGTQLAEADDAAKRAGLTRFICTQDELSLIRRGVETMRVPVMIERAISLVPYLPLASGLLTGKFRRGLPKPKGARLSDDNHRAAQFVTPANLELVYAIADFCEWRALDMLDVAFAWLLAKPYVASVIAGAVTPEQIDRNVRAAESMLSVADIGELNAMTRKALASQRS